MIGNADNIEFGIRNEVMIMLLRTVILVHYYYFIQIF